MTRISACQMPSNIIEGYTVRENKVSTRHKNDRALAMSKEKTNPKELLSLLPTMRYKFSLSQNSRVAKLESIYLGERQLLYVPHVSVTIYYNT